MSATVATTAPSTASKAAPSSGPFLPHEVDLNQLRYSDVKQMGNGPAKMCWLDYGNNKLVLETPWMMSYDGIRQPPAEFRDEGAPPKYSIDFSLKGYKGENDEVKAFYDLLTKFQDKLLDDCCKPEYAFAWHKKKTMVRDVAEAIFTPVVKFSTDKNTGEVSDQYPPKFKLKVPCWEGEWKCDVYNSTTQTKVEGDLSTVVCGRLEARAIIQCTGLWFAGSKFGSSWKLVQMEYKPQDQAISGYAFRSPSTPAEPVAIEAEVDGGARDADGGGPEADDDVVVDSEDEE
jgi:hypothetical protein